MSIRIGLTGGIAAGKSVCMYRSRDNGFVAMQAFEYVDLEYRPLTGLEIIDRNAA